MRERTGRNALRHRWLVPIVMLGLVLPMLLGASTAAATYTGLKMPWPRTVYHSVTQTPGAYENCNVQNPPSHCFGFDTWAYDFGLSTGNTVSAAHSGTVLGYQFAFGVGACDVSYATKANYIVLNHGDGYSSQYWHLLQNSASVSPNQFVYQGHPLGGADTSGAACGTHLHFAVEATPPCNNGYNSCIGQSIRISFDEAGEPALNTSIQSLNHVQFSATYQSQSANLSLTPGQVNHFVVQYLNNGYDVWNIGMSGNKAFLGTWNPTPGQDQASVLGGATGCVVATNWYSCNRIRPTTTQVDPGQSAWFDFQVRGPASQGIYKLYLRPLIEGVLWMEDVGLYVQVTVVNP
jgi:hypothetical protein